MDMSTAKNVVIVAVLLGTAYLAYANRGRLLGILRPERTKKPKRRETGTRNAMTEVCKAFLMYANDFQGVYEPMYQASVGAISFERMRNVLKEWNIRMGNIGQPPICLKSWWLTMVADCDMLTAKELQARCQQVIQMILASGIIRDDQTEIMAKTETGMYYQESNNSSIESGQRLRVESPCWYLPSNPVRIVEKGYCEIIKV